jgi:hypothetical protein
MDSSRFSRRRQGRQSVFRRAKADRTFPFAISSPNRPATAIAAVRELRAVTRLFTGFEPLASELYGDELPNEEFSILDATIGNFRRPWT